MEKPRIHIDMDHCSVNFQKGKDEWRERHPDEFFPQSHLDFWIDLKPMPGFLKAHHELSKHFDVYMLTAPSIRNTACWTGKAIWVKKHLGEEWLKKLIVSYDKSQFSGAYLIDDGNAHGQSQYDGEHIRFDFDEKFLNWDDVLSYIMDKL